MQKYAAKTLLACSDTPRLPAPPLPLAVTAEGPNV